MIYIAKKRILAPISCGEIFCIGLEVYNCVLATPWFVLAKPYKFWYWQ